MFRILQLQKSIRRFTVVGNNVAKITTNLRPVRFNSSALAALKEEARADSSSSIQSVLLEIQNNLKKWGRISNKQVLDLSGCVLESDHLNSTQALAVIRCFTDLSIDMKPEQRVIKVEKLWKKLEKLCVHLEVGHYNALLRAYLDSEHSFNPTDFLAKMAENGVGPNRLTYQFLVERYCQTGDVDGATRIMKFMEEKEVPITQGVLNLLIMGHARNNDMESAEKVIDLMASKGLTADETTYGILLAEYARKGDAEKIVDFFKNEKYRDIFLDSRSITNILFQLVANGHSESVPQVLQAAPAIIQAEFHRLIHRLVSAGHAEGCISILAQATSYDEGFLARLNNFVVSQCAQSAKSMKDVDRLKAVVPENEAATLFMAALKNAFAAGDLDSALELVSEMQKAGIEMRTHMYFPLIASLARQDKIKELVNVMMRLQNKLAGADMYDVYQILRTAGWHPRTALDALLPPVGRFNELVKECMFRALIQRNFDRAEEIAVIPSRLSLKALPAFVSISILESIPVDKFVSIATIMISRGAGEAASPAADAADDAEATGEGAEASAAVPDVADELEEKEPEQAPSIPLMEMTQQQITDFIVKGVTKKLGRRNEKKLLLILEELAAHKLGISKEAAEELLSNVGEGKVKKAIKQLSETEFRAPAKAVTQKMELRLELLEEYLKFEHSEPVKQVLLNKRLAALCAINDPRTPEVFKETGELLPFALKSFIRYAAENDTTLGMELWHKYSNDGDLGPTFVFLATKLVEEGKVDDALEIMNKKKKFIGSRASAHYVGDLMFILRSSPDERCQTYLKEILGETSEAQQNFFNTQLNYLLSRKKFAEAVDLIENITEKSDLNQKRSRVRRLACALVDNEKYELLQRLQNILTGVLGEDESLCELSLVLLHCRKDRQAKRIIELSGQSKRIIRRVLMSNDLRSLESLLEILPTFHEQKDEICERVVQGYNETNDAENALAMYTRFEQESYTPSQKTLRTLRNLFIRCGYEVPFDTSLITDKQAAGVEQAPTVKQVAAVKQTEAVKQISEDKKKRMEEAKARHDEIDVSGVTDLDSLKAILQKDPETPKAFFKKALYKLDMPWAEKNKFTDEIALKAIAEKNFDRLMYVLPRWPRDQYEVFMRLLNSCNRDKYAEMMEEHVSDLSVMLKAYWFDAFLKGDDKVCEDLWLKHGLFQMIQTRKHSQIAGHEERYFKFFKKIEAPPERAVRPLVVLVRSKAKPSPEAAIEVLEQNTELIPHLNGDSVRSVRDLLKEGGAGEQLLSKFDELMKKHGVNVPVPKS